MKTIQPFGDRALVKVAEPQQQTASGLYVPETSRQGPSEGVIVAIGEGSPLQERLSVGDTVLYAKLSGTEITLDGERYTLLDESDILGRLVEVYETRTADDAQVASAVAAQ